MRALILILLLLAACGDDDGARPDGPPAGEDARGPDAFLPTGAACEPLAAATGGTPVTPSDDLAQLVYDAAPGTTLLLADGTYTLTATLQVHGPGITLRSQSGTPEAVVLDGNYAVNELIAVTSDDVTIAELTLMRAVDHPVHIVPPVGADLLRPRLYRVNIVDGGSCTTPSSPATPTRAIARSTSASAAPTRWPGTTCSAT